MEQKSKNFSALIVFVVVLGLLGCGVFNPVLNLSDAASGPDDPPQSEASSNPKEVHDSIEPSRQMESGIWGSVITTTPISEPPVAIYTPTPDLRMLPEQWRDWPVVPTVTNRAVQIYQEGLARGNNARAFSKVGDCHCVNSVFFGIYDRGWYSLPEEDWYLNETIDYFEDSFTRESAAVHGGFTGASVLSPLWADARRCERGETPLTCELRLHQPSIVLISLEVWWSGRNAQSYSDYMRQILDEVIAHGAVPILATKADNVEGDHSINLATARLAYEYDLPLWNFWRSVQGLEGDGIDTSRDNFHLTVEAWDRRSFTGLKALDSVWRGLLEAQNNSQIEIKASPTLQSEQVNTPGMENTAIVETATTMPPLPFFSPTPTQITIPWPTITPGSPVASPTSEPGENRKD